MRSLTIILILVFITGTTSVSFAQNNQMEAKAAYMLAEEEFNNAKYTDAIKYLDEAITKLGTANAKILYLKIMSYKALAEKDKKYNSKLLETIAAFEKAPDVADFNEEKSLEVVKLKLAIKRSEEAIVEADKAAAEEKQRKLELQMKAIREVSYKGMRLGMTEDALYNQDIFSKKHTKRNELQDTLRHQLFYPPHFWKAVFQPTIYADFMNGSLVRIEEKWLWYSIKGFAKPKDTLNALIKIFGEPMTRTTKTEIVPLSNRAVHKNWTNQIAETLLTWTLPDRKIEVQYREIINLHKGQPAYKDLGGAEMKLQMSLY